MKDATDLSRSQIYRVFDMLDVDGSGEMDFDEFYLLACILVAIKVKLNHSTGRKNLYNNKIANPTLYNV